MTIEHAEALVTTILLPNYAHLKPTPQQAANVVSWLRHRSEAAGERAVKWHKAHSRFWPTEADLNDAEAKSASERPVPEYVDGRRVSRHKPWHLTEEGQQAIERQDRIVLLDDEHYDEMIATSDPHERESIYRRGWAALVQRELGDDVRPSDATAQRVARAIRERKRQEQRDTEVAV